MLRTIRTNRIALVTLMSCAFVLAASWIVQPTAKGSAQNIGKLYYTEWSPPELVTELSTSQHEVPGSLSSDGLSLYFHRFTPDTLEDLYVAHRPDTESKWGVPVRLPDWINTKASEQMPYVSPDGHWLYFSSDCTGGLGGPDMYLAWRADVENDFAWQMPVNLAAVNTVMCDLASQLFADDTTGVSQLYLTMDATVIEHQPDIYMSTLGSNGWGPPSPVTELNSPMHYFFDGFPAIRYDGREIFISSNRPGTRGETDVWVSRRASITDPWSPPENVTALNNEKQNQATVLSRDGQTMYLAIGDPNANDIYVSHRELVSASNACFRSPQYYLHKIQFLNTSVGNASVIIGGVNYNHPISVANNLDLVRRVLQGNVFPGMPPSAPLDWFNQEFLAAQLSIGGIGSPAASSILNGQLQCYDSLANFQPLTLSNGVTLTRYSTLGELFEQARLALCEDRCQDRCEMVAIFDLLNGNDPYGYCRP